FSLGLPALGGTPRVGPPPAWGPPLVRAPMPYAGLVPLLLAAVALLIARHHASFFFGLLAIGSFALALNSPLLQLFMTVVPVYRQFEDHTRWFVLWYFAVAILAAIGANALLQHDEPAEPDDRWLRVANRALLGGAALFLVAWSLWQLQLFTPQSQYGTYITLIRQQPLGVAAAIAVASLLALALLLAPAFRAARPALLALAIGVAAFDLLWYGGAYNTSVDLATLKPTRDLTEGLSAYPAAARDPIYPPTRQVAFLLSQPGPFRILGGDYTALPPNLASTSGLEDIRGYQSLYFERYNRFARLVDGKDYSKTGEGNISLRAYFSSAYKGRRLLDMLNVKYVVFAPGSVNPQLFAPLELVQQTDEGAIYRNPNVLPRAWLVHAVEVIADDNAQLARMARPDFDPAAIAIVPSAAPAVAAPQAHEPAPAIDYAPNQATVQAHVAAPALLMLSDAYSDDWYATVDGQPAPLYRANYTFRGVWLPAGDHTIVFVYRPRAFLIGGAISALTLLALVGSGLWPAWRSRGPRSPRG
ncbi:MAG TPA: YfhO family protein, partial [Roseiflexaceae bacterium]